MDKIIRTVASKSALIGMILLFLAAGFSFIVNAAGIGGEFMPVIGGLFTLLFDLAILGIVPVLIALKKHDLIKYALVPLLAYWFISTIYNFLAGCEVIYDGVDGLIIAIAMFEFFAACALLTALVFAVMYFFSKDRKWLQIGFVVFAGSLLFFLLVWALRLAFLADLDADWTSYLYAFCSLLFLPSGLVFVTLTQLPMAEAADSEDTADVDSFLKQINGEDEEPAKVEDEAEEPVVEAPAADEEATEATPEENAQDTIETKE